MTSTTPADLDVTYDFVGIIDFLPDRDRKTYGLGDKLVTLLNRNRVAWQQLNCLNKQGFAQALLHFAKESKKGKAFGLQLIGHGDSSGLVMPEGPIMAWHNIAPGFRAFDPNILSQCILNLSCCFGLNGIKITDHLPDAGRFFGVLGPSRPIGFDEAYKVNSKIYRKWAEGMKFNDIIREVNKEFGKQILYGLTSQGYHTFKVKSGKSQKPV